MSSDAVPSRRSATPTATCRRCNRPWPGRARFALFAQHDDAQREYAYDRTDRLQLEHGFPSRRSVTTPRDIEVLHAPKSNI
ncbi:MAG TPA: hypothetical protein VJ808_05115 [Gemmatimonadales bacterium]|nr:hypothetical protein [Gemmatimonadales bacterium]